MMERLGPSQDSQEKGGERQIWAKDWILSWFLCPSQRNLKGKQLCGYKNIANDGNSMRGKKLELEQKERVGKADKQHGDKTQNSQIFHWLGLHSSG